MENLNFWHIWIEFPAGSNKKFDGYFLTDNIDSTIEIIEKTNNDYLCVYFQAC